MGIESLIASLFSGIFPLIIQLLLSIFTGGLLV
jgi:hypothetical protein